MPSTAEVAAHRADVAELTALAESDLQALATGAAGISELRELLASVLPGLVAIYGAAAASLAADWYDDIRDAASVRGRFRAIVADLPDVGRTDALAGWSTAQAIANAQDSVSSFESDRGVVVVKAQGGLQRVVADAARQTITRSAVQDPSAVGWQRLGFGSCGFCQLLISRGKVYTERTADFASHDHCNCQAVPIMRGGEPIDVKDYVKTSRNVSDADRARTREYIRAKNL